jgi:hypothetical protein
MHLQDMGKFGYFDQIRSKNSLSRHANFLTIFSQKNTDLGIWFGFRMDMVGILLVLLVFEWKHELR